MLIRCDYSLLDLHLSHIAAGRPQRYQALTASNFLHVLIAEGFWLPHTLQCLKFSTDQQADLKRVEALNNTFFRLMARGPDAGAHPPCNVQPSVAARPWM
jgi:hypothetical protein